MVECCCCCPNGGIANGYQSNEMRIMRMLIYDGACFEQRKLHTNIVDAACFAYFNGVNLNNRRCCRDFAQIVQQRAQSTKYDDFVKKTEPNTSLDAL